MFLNIWASQVTIAFSIRKWPLQHLDANKEPIFLAHFQVPHSWYVDELIMLGVTCLEVIQLLTQFPPKFLAQGIPGSLFGRIGDHPTLRSCPSDLRTHLRSAQIPSQDPGLAEAAELQSYFAVEGKEVEGLGAMGCYGMLFWMVGNG